MRNLRVDHLCAAADESEEDEQLAIEDIKVPPAAVASPEIAEDVAIVAASAVEMKVVTVVLPAASSDKKRSQDQAALARALHQGVPMLNCVMRPALPPIPNGIGGEWYFDPPAPRKSKTKLRKDLRRDFMTGVAATMRDIERCKPLLVFGIG